MIPITDFALFEDILRALYAEEKYNEIIEIIDEEGGRFPAEGIYLKYWQITMAARAKKYELVFHFMDNLIDSGLWISYQLLVSSPSLEDLQELLEYRSRVEKMGVLQTKEVSQLLPLLTLRKSDEMAKTYPLLIGLHQERALALSSIKFFQPVASQGWLVGVPQSSQAMWSGAYVWEDRDLVQREIENHIVTLKASYPVDTRRIIIAGHRNGGEIAAWLPLSGGVSARGFIAINPSGPYTEDLTRWTKLLQARFPGKIRGAYIFSEDTPAAGLKKGEQLVQLFNSLDVACRFEVVPGVGQDYDPAYDDPIKRAVDFILT